MKRSFTVTMKIPEGVTLYQAQLYIEEAVKSWCEFLEPPGYVKNVHTTGDLMHNLDPDSVTVRAQVTG